MIFANLGKCLNNLQLLEVSKHICNIWKVSKVFTSLGKCVIYLQVLESAKYLQVLESIKSIHKSWKVQKYLQVEQESVASCKWQRAAVNL